MKKRWLKFTNVKRPGFTIVESLISLIMVAMATFLIATFSALLLRDLHHRDNTVNFYLYLNELENNNYRVVDCDRRQLSLVNPSKHHQYRIKLYKNLIIMTGLRGGYVPLLKNVKDVDWSYQHHCLVSRLVMSNQQKFSAKSWLDKCSKKVR